MKIYRPLLIVISLALVGGLALSFGLKNISLVKNHKTLFACPTFDTSGVVVKTSDCGASNGSIVGLSGMGTGVLVYTWYNALGVRLSSGADLLHIPPGTYRVSLQDESKCPAISLMYTVLENNPVSIDYTSGTITSPTCGALNGSVTGIIVHNATRFEWLDETYKVISGQTTKDLLNVGPGTYILNARNANGCLAQQRYTINPGGYAPIMTVFSYDDSDCGATGQFHATFDMKPGDPGYAWAIEEVNSHKTYFDGVLSYNPKDSTRIVIPAPMPKATDINLNPGLPAGNYTLTTVGPGNCFTLLAKFTIITPEYKIDTSHMLIKTNVCGQNTGVILNLGVTGGPPPVGRPADRDPTHGWFWYNSDGKRLSYIGNYLGSQPSGWYTVYAVNYEGCQSNTVRLFLPDSISTASKPELNDIKMCLPGTVGLDVLNKDSGAHYKLYDSTQQTVLDTSTAGYFARKVTTTTTYYVQSINGICGSPLGRVTVTIVNPGVSIPNTFTPNNDAINDHWEITGLDQYPGTEVSVFNRNGLRVYHTINYSIPFNGQYSGKDLPIGVYYYIIDTKKPDCRGGVSGSLTIIR